MNKVLWHFVCVVCCLPLHGANLLPNSSFELSGRTGWGWLGDNNASEPSTNIRVAYGSAWHGGYVGEISGNGTTNILRVVSLPIRLKPSTQYTFSVYVRESAGNSTANLEIENANGSDSTISSNFSLTSSWQRFSVSHTTSANFPSSYQVYITKSTSASTAEIQFDGAQLETGGSATAWAAASNVELGFDHHATRWGNTFRTDTAVVLPLRLYNYTVSSTNITVGWESHDWFNARQASGEVAYTLASGLTDSTLTLSSTNLGYRRVSAWLRNHDKSGDEITYNILPITNTLANLTNGLFGTHCVASPYYLRQYRAMGFTWNRTLSGVGVEAAANPFRWTEAEPTDNNFVYFDGDISNILAENFKILAVLGEGVGSTPSFALTNGFPDLDPFWMDYMTNMVDHYKASVDYWEILNEPEGEGGYNGKAQLNVDQIQDAYDIIKARDDAGGAYVVGPTIAGNSWDPGEHGDQVIIDLGGTNYLDILSQHTYPGPSVESIVGKVRAITDVVQFETWNTEGGKKNMSGHRTVPWEDVHTESVRYVRSHRYFGTMPLTVFPRFRDNWNSKFFYYDGRPMGPNTVEDFSLFDWDQSLKPTAAAMAWHIKLLDESSLIGDLALANSAEGYTLTSPRHTSIGIFLGDTEILAGRTNVYHLTTTDSANCTFYDAVGNALTYNSGIRFSGASPLYITSTSATNTFHTSFTVVVTNDMELPKLDIVNGPRGVITDTANRYFRWYAEDNAGFMRSTSDSNDDAINFRYRLDAGSWSSWGRTNAVTYASIPSAGILQVQARDPAGNIAEDSWSWPANTGATPPPTDDKCATYP